MGVLNESGLYKIIMRANTSNPQAREFQQWVAREVLPSIRKTGGYLLNERARETAHADTREAMPMPAEFMAVFQKQAEAADL